MGRLSVEGDRQIYFERHVGGPGKRRTVVLSHGWGMGCRVWDDTVARLVDAGHAAIIYDHRCCGQSDKDFADVSIEALGADLAALCRHLELDGPVLNGWSLGGAVVVDAAIRLGGNLGGLVLTGGATPRYTQGEGFPHGGQAADVAATVAALRADRVGFLKSLYFDGVFAKDVGEDVKDWCWRIALQASTGADASLGALAQLDQRTAMADFSCPALVAIGGQDGVVAPEIGRHAAGCLANAELVEFEDCGHAVFLEDAERYHGVLLDFLAGAAS